MKRLLLIPVFVLFLFSACNDEEIPNAFEIGLEQDFQHGEINLSDNNTLKFLITEINDSRCPSDVVCVWAGKADVKIEIEAPQKGSLTLSTYDNRIDTFGVYVFQLIDVSPYPISTKNIELKDYDVKLKITEL